MNRAERRAAGKRRGPWKIPAYDREGREVFAQYVPEDREPHDQVRVVVLDGEAAKNPPFKTVAEAEAAGRLDLIRCFVLDRSVTPWRMVEQEDGRDPAPMVPVAKNFLRSTHASVMSKEVVDLAHQILALVPDAMPIQAFLLAFIETEFEAGKDPDPDRVIKFVVDSGYATDHSPMTVLRELQTLPALRVRWMARKEGAHQ